MQIGQSLILWNVYKNPQSPDYETWVDLWSDTIAMAWPFQPIPRLFYSSLNPFKDRINCLWFPRLLPVFPKGCLLWVIYPGSYMIYCIWLIYCIGLTIIWIIGDWWYSLNHFHSHVIIKIDASVPELQAVYYAPLIFSTRSLRLQFIRV